MDRRSFLELIGMTAAAPLASKLVPAALQANPAILTATIGEWAPFPPYPKKLMSWSYREMTGTRYDPADIYGYVMDRRVEGHTDA